MFRTLSHLPNDEELQPQRPSVRFGGYWPQDDAGSSRSICHRTLYFISKTWFGLGALGVENLFHVGKVFRRGLSGGSNSLTTLSGSGNTARTWPIQYPVPVS